MYAKQKENYMKLLAEASAAGLTLNAYKKQLASGTLSSGKSSAPVPPWICARCTFENPPENKRCSMCENPKPSVAAPRKFTIVRKKETAPSTSTLLPPSSYVPGGAAGGNNAMRGIVNSFAGLAVRPGQVSLQSSAGLGRPGTVGLQNPKGKTHNKCFINGPLQLLFAIPELTDRLTRLTPENILALEPAKIRNINTGVLTNRPIPTACGKDQKELILSLKLIFEGMRSGTCLDTEKVKVGNSNVYSKILALDPGVAHYGQSDAAGIVNSLLGLFNPYSECLGFEDLVRQIYIGEIHKDVILASGSEERLAPDQKMTFLSIPIYNKKKPNTLSELLTSYQMPEVIEDQYSRVNRFRRNNGTYDQIVSQQSTITLHEEQRVVVIQVKRFEFNPDFTSRKIRSVVVADEKISIDNKHFILEGCIIHSGELAGGHYVYLTFDNGKPNLIINDEKISKDNDYLRTLHTDGYVYLYRRIANNDDEIRNAVSAAQRDALAASRVVRRVKYSSGHRGNSNDPNLARAIAASLAGGRNTRRRRHGRKQTKRRF